MRAFLKQQWKPELRIQYSIRYLHILSLFYPDPCENFRCKRGKTCKINDENKPVCVCQEPSECPPSVNDFDHVSMCNLANEFVNLNSTDYNKMTFLQMFIYSNTDQTD